jgi:hypothetical protein
MFACGSGDPLLLLFNEQFWVVLGGLLVSLVGILAFSYWWCRQEAEQEVRHRLASRTVLNEPLDWSWLSSNH